MSFTNDLHDGLEEAEGVSTRFLFDGQDRPGVWEGSDEVGDMESVELFTFSHPDRYVVEYIRDVSYTATLRLAFNDDIDPLLRVIEHLGETTDSDAVVREADRALEHLQDEMSESLGEQLME